LSKNENTFRPSLKASKLFSLSLTFLTNQKLVSINLAGFGGKMAGDNRLFSGNKILIFLLVISMAIWGGSWTSAKIISGMINPLILTFLRFIISFIAFAVVSLFMKENLKIDKKGLLLAIISSVLLTVYNYLFFKGLKTGLAGAGGVLVTSINPLFTFTLSLIILKIKIKLKEIIGLILGLSAGLVLLGIWKLNFDDLFASGNLIFLSASFIWAFVTLLSGEIQKKVSIFVYSFYVYGFSSVIIFILSIPYGIGDIFKMDYIFWLNIIYLSIASTVFATSIFFVSSKKMSANKASSFILLVPVFAVLTSFIILNEKPGLATIIGGTLAIIGIYLINRKDSQEIYYDG
jgi:drug/metabolite transporter (DMT)-like permease